MNISKLQDNKFLLIRDLIFLCQDQKSFIHIYFKFSF